MFSGSRKIRWLKGSLTYRLISDWKILTCSHFLFIHSQNACHLNYLGSLRRGGKARGKRLIWKTFQIWPHDPNSVAMHLPYCMYHVDLVNNLWIGSQIFNNTHIYSTKGIHSWNSVCNCFSWSLVCWLYKYTDGCTLIRKKYKFQDSCWEKHTVVIHWPFVIFHMEQGLLYPTRLHWCVQ